jgi:hypothetical protein
MLTFLGIIVVILVLGCAIAVFATDVLTPISIMLFVAAVVKVVHG